MTLTAIQHQERLTGLGASDSAVALGLSPWKTPLELYLEKTQELDAPDLSGNELIKWGNRLETAIADGWSEDTGIKVARVNQTLRHPQYPFMLCHLDRRQVGQRRVLECKNVGHFYGNQAFGESGTDQVPDQYLIQVHHQISIVHALWEWTGGELAALIGGNDLRTFSFDYDPEVDELLTTRLQKFWKHVETRNPPEPTSVGDLDLLFAQDNGQIKDVVDVGLVDVWQRLHDMKAAAGDQAKEIKALELELKLAIAESAGIQVSDTAGPDSPGIAYAGKTLATWKTQTRTSLDTKQFQADHPDLFNQYSKTSSFRVLRLTKP